MTDEMSEGVVPSLADVVRTAVTGECCLVNVPFRWRIQLIVAR